jgi:hypothetical protein
MDGGAGVVSRDGEAAVLAGESIVADGVAGIPGGGVEQRDRGAAIASCVDLQHINPGANNGTRTASIDQALKWLNVRSVGDQLRRAFGDNYAT